MSNGSNAANANATDPIALSKKELAADLPRVCLCCGAPATVIRPKEFWLRAPIQNVPSRGIIGVTRMLLQVSEAAGLGEHRLNAPFCPTHANYWSHGVALTATRLAPIAVFIIGLVGAAVLSLTVSTAAALGWAAVSVLILFAFAALTIVWQSSRIEQMEPNPDFLVLSNVSRPFHDALDRLRDSREAVRVIPYSSDELALLQRRQKRWRAINALVLPAFGTVAFLFVAGVLALIGPPSGLPKPGGGPATRGNDLHCYEQLMTGHVSREARSWLRGHPNETVEHWDHATTVKNVDELYALGAKKVFYHPVLLLVVLPSEPDARARLLQWTFTNIQKGQGDRIPDERQSYLMIAPN